MEVGQLSYGYGDLEPYFDEQTMKIHHDKHHQAYFDNFIKVIADQDSLKDKDVKEILSNLDQVSEEIKQVVINHGGGYFHHSFFWTILKKEVPFQGEIAEAIKEKYGGFETFKEEFSKAAMTVFGSGWAWLVVNKNKELEIIKTKNQDSPVSLGKEPLLALDVWEHAYYLKYQNRRLEYVNNFFSVINWEKVNEYYLGDKNG